MGGGMKRAAANAVTVARWHLERALYTIRANRLREFHSQMLAGEIPQERYAQAHIEFWNRYERGDDEQS